MKHHRINDVIKSNNKLLFNHKKLVVGTLAVKIYRMYLFKNGYDLRLAATLMIKCMSIVPVSEKIFQEINKKKFVSTSLFPRKSIKLIPNVLFSLNFLIKKKMLFVLANK